MHPNIRRAHEELVRKFLYPGTGLFYTQRFESDADFPTVEEVSERIPDSNCGRGYGLGDCCLLTGFILEGMMQGYRLSGDPALAEHARKVFQGMVFLGTTPDVKGFIPRGIAPGRTDYFFNTSVDQYTTFFSSVWRYATSDLATAEERAVAAEMCVNACTLIESHNFDIPKADFSARCIFGELSEIKPGRSERLLMFLRIAHELSGDRHWLDLYHEKMEEDDRARLRTCSFGPTRHNPYTSFHGVIQTQLTLRTLLDLGDDDDVCEHWRRALADHAARVMSKIDPWFDFTQVYYCCVERDEEEVWRDLEGVLDRWYFGRGGDQMEYNFRIWFHYMKRNDLFRYLDPSHGRAHHIVYPIMLPPLWQFLSAVATVMLSDEQAQKKHVAEMTSPLLSGLDFSNPPTPGATGFLGLAYWPGVAAGLFPAA